ncbi:hypothetical protein BD779DRAFT_1516440 [Infundibulicybe gibba]|nr:hypothetical protein BD779DRAFT_1516440 [Infundibulicybe gibba]
MSNQEAREALKPNGRGKGNNVLSIKHAQSLSYARASRQAYRGVWWFQSGSYVSCGGMFTSVCIFLTARTPWANGSCTHMGLIDIPLQSNEPWVVRAYIYLGGFVVFVSANPHRSSNTRNLSNNCL